MVASGSPRAAEAAVFDLDEDVTTEPGEPVVDPVATFDLDEERPDDVGVAARRVAPDVPPEVMVFDLDEDCPDDGQQPATTTDLDKFGPDVLGLDEEVDLDQGLGDDDDGSLWEPPDDISADDLREAQRDQQHTRLMGQYMTSRGVIP